MDTKALMEGWVKHDVTPQSHFAHIMLLNVFIWSIKFNDLIQKRQKKHMEQGGREAGTEPIILLQYILGKEDKYIQRTCYLCKISDLLLSEIKEKLTNLLNATFCFLIMHQTGTKAGFSSNM